MKAQHDRTEPPHRAEAAGSGDGAWEHWAVPLSPENPKGAQVMRGPVLLICTSRKTQLKPPVLGLRAVTASTQPPAAFLFLNPQSRQSST